ncbi:HD-GYP domain-containing protein, partial [Actinomadura alba]|nr:metal-dependent phosphohydrolase [Actinomadura alba]
FARIISVADAFDAMTSTRSYRPARPIEDAVAELRRSAGSQFDPDIVTAFLHALRTHGWQLPDPVAPPDDDIAEITQQDHDDPSAPIAVTGEGDPAPR